MNHDHNLLSQIRDSSNLKDLVPVFIFPRNRVARLYTQALGSLFVASYDSQGYGGGIRPRLNMGTEHSESESESELLYDWRFTANQFVLVTSPLRLTPRIFFPQLNTCGHSPYIISSLTRGRVCRLELLLALASAFILGSESRGIRDHILLSQIRHLTLCRLLRLAGLRWRYLTPPPHATELPGWCPRYIIPLYVPRTKHLF
jgi:hypothetical protein